MGLILAIIGILVIAASLGATAYYGGDSYVDSTIKAEANTFLSEASQVRSAVTLYKAHELALPDTTAELITERHLGSETSKTFVINGPANSDPVGGPGTGQLTATSTVNDGLTAEVCLKIEEAATDTEVTTLPSAPVVGQIYGCYDNASVNTMYYN